MSNSKNMLLILTKNSANNRGLLNWEIKECIENYNLPITVVNTICSGELFILGITETIGQLH